MLEEKHILKALSHLVLPDGTRVTDTRMISSVIIKEDSIGFAINIDEASIPYALELKEKAQKIITDSLNYSKVTAVLTSFSDLGGVDLPSSKNLIKLKPIEVSRIICITSCKGGVGKSTITYLLAKELAANGIKVGVLDADIYGPSMPKLFNIKDDLQIIDNLMQPFIVDNIQIISIGNIIDANKAGIWRGPMVTKNIHQLLFKTNWQDIDILLVDMPPGTGDVALSLAENYHLDSAIIVTTPSDLALIDNIKTIDMLNKLEIKILGVIENMSYYQIGELITKPFGEGGGKHVLKLTNTNNFIEIPLQENILTKDNKYLQKMVNYIITN